MTKNVKISITAEIDNSQRMKAKFVIQSANFKIGEITVKAILESYGYQTLRDQNRVLGKMSYFEEKKITNY